tara:strand:+ start:1207 stop:1641 length:435 start_codon:yes stop_codon:yes gene_type:complete
MIEFKGDKEKWDFIRTLLTETEEGLLDTVGQDKLMLLMEKSGDPCLMMNDDELEEFHALPDVIEIYRGIASEEELDFDKFGHGIHWTKSFKTAEWFAERFESKNKCILTGKVLKENVIAYFNEKNEDELLINPNKVIGMSICIL